MFAVEPSFQINTCFPDEIILGNGIPIKQYHLQSMILRKRSLDFKIAPKVGIDVVMYVIVAIVEFSGACLEYDVGVALAIPVLGMNAVCSDDVHADCNVNLGMYRSCYLVIE